MRYGTESFWEKMSKGRFNSVLVIGILIFASLGHCEGDVIHQPKSCDRNEALLRAKHVYTYQYTITTSSSFVGATGASSGSQITCKVTVSVPRKCELTLQLSSCEHEETIPGWGGYPKTADTAQFIQELERFPVYFQMNKGVVLEDSIVVSDQEPVYILNIKRGLISQLQFSYLNSMTTSVENDVFGSCPVEYTFSQDTPNTVTSKRNLRQCQMPQVFKRQFPTVGFGSSVKRQQGGFIEDKISEAIYPFVSEVTCHYTLGDKKTLDSANCFQQQYFKPLAYKGDIFATAMANISQHLQLETYKVRRSQPKPDYSLNGRHITKIKFEFTDDDTTKADQTQLKSLLTKINQKIEEEDFEMTPDYFGDLVEMSRGTSMSVLEFVRDDVFNCQAECNSGQLQEQNVFMDVLSSCGTDSCLEVYLDCLQNGQVGWVDGNMFLQSLAAHHTMTESFLEKLLSYCKSSGTTSCWLSLGTLLSKTKTGEDADLKLDGALGQTMLHFRKILKEQCYIESLTISEKEMIQIFKVIENIGYGVVRKLYSKIRPDPSDPHADPIARVIKCAQVPSMPKPVIRAILQLIHQGLDVINFVKPPKLQEFLFVLLKDVNKDTVLRGTAFTLLMKTTNKDTIKKLAKYIQEPNTRQMKAYMISSVRTLLENDEPTLKIVRSAWEEVKREDDNSFDPRTAFDSYSWGMSKTINVAHFFKLPITEYLGGQVYMDLIFDPSAIVFSQFKISVNYFHGDHKYNIFEVTANVQGFDMLFETLLGRNKLSLMQLYTLCKQSKAPGQDEDATLYDKFQKDLIRKVMEILEQVNHPKFPDFECAVDLMIYGKNVHFFSLNDLMSYIRQIKAHAPPDQPTMAQKLMGLLKKGIHRHLFNFREVMSLVKQIPTCAGLPMNMTVRVNTFHSLIADVAADVTAYLKKTGPLTASLDVSGRVAAELKGQLLIPVGTNHNSGISLRGLIGGGKSVGIGLTYSHVVQGRESKIPFSGTLQLDVRNMDKDKDTVIVAYAKSEMLLLHQSSGENIPGDPAFETKYQRCYPQWLVLITGRSLCVNFVYPNVSTSRTHAYFPLSGPFNLEIELERADP